jgi:Zn-dependent protease with chaperone function
MARNSSANPDYSILAAFDAGIVCPKLSIFYRFGLMLVAVAMLLLPLIYLALAGTVAWLVYYHAVHNWGAIMKWGGGGSGQVMIGKFLIYIIPLLAGIVVVFFLFKPLLARRPKRAQPLALNPADNPLLYAFIERVCVVVGAPSPRRIDLDCDLNASASFRRGLLSLFGKDLVLTIGMPLAANLSARELAGVIAHEFGHFTQGAGMRLSYLVRSVSAWFARAAYERDAWDEALEDWSEKAGEADVRAAILVWMVQLAVWFSRLILKALMYIGIIVGGFISRQMEYDADAYEIKVAGSEAFERTTRKLATLGVAMEVAVKQLAAIWERTGTLPDNFPEVLRNAHEQLPPHVVQKINDTLGLHRTGIFDSHPSPADRIRRARQAEDPGIFHDERPASELFGSFEHPARFVTLLHYTDDLDIPITPQMLTHIESKPSSGTSSSTVAQAPAAAGTGEESEAWMFGLLTFLLPLSLDPAAASADVASDFSELSHLSAGLRQIQEQLNGFGSQEAGFLDKLASARAAQRVLNHGVALQPDLLGPAGCTGESAAMAERDALQARENLRHALHEVLPALRRRLELGLSLALANADASEAGGLREKCAGLTDWLNRHAGEHARRQDLAAALAVLDKINAVKAAQGESPELGRALEEQQAAVRSLAAEFDAKAQPAEPKPRLRVQLSKGTVQSDNEMSRIGEQNRNWQAEYDEKIAQLLQIASSVEGAPA